MSSRRVLLLCIGQSLKHRVADWHPTSVGSPPPPMADTLDYAPRPVSSENFPDWSVYDYQPLSNLVFARGIQRLREANFYDTLVGLVGMMLIGGVSYGLGYYRAKAASLEDNRKKL